ncbi:hypothetical protein Btru_028363, partial [Bulinus truncatus]
ETSNGTNPKSGIKRFQSLDKIFPVALSWSDINVHVRIPMKKNWFSVCGLIQPGNLVALMGASGAGKSTLLNVLTSRNIKHYTVTGEVRVEGWNIGSCMTGISAYVQQNDIFISTLTVREQLQFRALLRMDNKLDKATRLRRVEEVIVEMGLTNCADSRIGDIGGSKKGISGGERKRLSFASEALTKPPIFFCDEPTSGLDSFMAQSIVATLQNMASKGRVVLCTIHQPSSELFAMFDQILLLSEGRTAFMGTQQAAMEFFQRHGYPCPLKYNPSDHYILTLAIVPGQEEERLQRTKEICDQFLDTEEYVRMWKKSEELAATASHSVNDPLLNDIMQGESRYREKLFTQVRCLYWRGWVSMYRHTMLTRVRILQAVVLSVVLGLIYLRQTVNQKSVMSINGALFILITSITFSNVLVVVDSFPIELPVFLREYGTGLYRADVYYLTKVIAEIPLIVLVTVVFSTISYWMIGLYDSTVTFLVATGVLLLTANVSVALGYLMSNISGTVSIALAITPPMLVPFMLFGGLFINIGGTPVYFIWLEYLSWFKYANEILMVNQWENVDYIPCTNVSTLSINGSTIPPPLCLYRSGQDVLDYTSFSQDNVNIDVIALVALQVGFQMLSLVAFLCGLKMPRNR